MSVPYLQNKERVLVQLAEDIARDTPERVYAVVPKSADLSDGFVEFTFREAINAVNFIGRWLKLVLGQKPDHDFESLTYIGVSDLRYTLLTLACIKCGYKILLPSPRNSVQVNLSLMQSIDSSKILYSSELESTVKSLASSSIELQTFQIPSFEEMIVGEVAPIPYAPPFEEALDHPVVVLHSSGSTGPPKPIVFTNGSIATLGADWDFKVPEGRKIVGLPLFESNGRECRYFGPMPPFHLGGLYYRTIAPIYSLAVPIYQPAAWLPNAELVLEILQRQEVQAVVLPPSLIEGLLHVPGGLESLKKLDWIMFSGGPLSQSAGDQIRNYTTLFPYYGSTELLAIRQITPQPANWSWHEFHTADHFCMEPFHEDVYELVALPDSKKGPGNPGSAAFMHSLPGTEVYHTKDLFRKHPDRDIWQFFGRTDDIIVLSSGEKINPGPFENELKSEAAIADALIVGSNRRRPALLVEPKPDQRDSSDLRDRIWAVVQRVNATASGPGRVSKELLLIADPERPFLRTGKGSVVRKTTISAYEQDIERLYRNAEAGLAGQGKIDAGNYSPAEIRDLVRSALDEVMLTGPPDDTSNLYLHGLDSLSTADVISSLTYSIGRQPWLVPNICYTNPSVERLASAIYACIENRSADEGFSRTKKLKDFLERLMTGFGSTSSRGRRSSRTNQPDELTVTVTGTTGSLGSALVDTLLRSPNVKQVICLNRSNHAQELWEKRSKSAQLKLETPIFHAVDVMQQHLGLSSAAIRQVQSSDLLIHNAWRVDFNLDLSSFEDNLKGLRNILDFCSQAADPPRLVYISSLSSVSSMPIIPEQAVDDAAACSPMGYGESKFVAERMLDQAAATVQTLDITVIRVGQIAGSRAPGGAPWPSTEAIPGIIQTSRSLGLIPSNLPAVRWVPIDEAAKTIIEISTANHVSPGKVWYCNLANPHQTQWQSLVGPVKQFCGPQAKTVPMHEWADALAQADYADKAQLAKKPALKVMQFIRHLASNDGQAESVVEVGRAVEHSKTLELLSPIREDDLTQWIAQF